MIILIADRIKLLREQKKLSQTALANILFVTRSSVNAWEMGISIPTTVKLIELSEFFHVTTDYLLGRENGVNINIDSLSNEEREILFGLIKYFDNKKETN